MRKQKGITLIALVITIIVLLILAGVTIATLTGDNGLLTKAGKAKNTSEKGEIEEQIKLAGLEYQTAKNIETNQNAADYIRSSLEKIYDNVKVTPKSETEVFPITVKVKEYVYELNDNLSLIGPIDFKKLETLYGKVVNGYTAGNNLDDTKKVDSWKLLYIDEEYNEAILISSNLVSLLQSTENGIPLVSNAGVEYTGSNNIKNFEYGRKYNGLWLEYCNTESTYNNAKATAYLCDPSNWSEYVTGKAKYAAGGATREILVASFYNVQVKDFKDENYSGNGAGIRNINKSGYLAMPEGFKVTGFYSVAHDTWIASPTYFYAYGNNSLTYLHSNGSFVAWPYNSKFYLRPIVCIPVSAIKINETGNDITLEYK